MHNAALLNMANTCGGRSVDVSQLRHLTDQLSSEQKKNKMLSERLQELEAHVEQKLKKEDFSVSHPGDSYLITMLSDEKSKNRELQVLKSSACLVNASDELLRSSGTVQNQRAGATAGGGVRPLDGTVKETVHLRGG